MENPGPAELEAFGPQWVLYWGGGLARSQYAIWEPYLRRSRHRFLVLVDGRGTVPPDLVAAAADLPHVAFASGGWDKAQLRGVRSLRGVLYVGHRPQNPGAIAALPQVAHVFIGHGNSGKRSSGSRLNLQYDTALLASYADLVRYPPPVRRQLRLRACAIGAPIVEGLSAPRTTAAVPERPRVLYLPTWEGRRAGADYSSLAVVLDSLREHPPQELGELVARPHPGTGNVRPEVRAVRDELLALTTPAPVADKAGAMLRADVAVCDISGAASEFLFTRKPVVLPWGPHLRRRDLTRQRVAELYPYAYLWDVRRQTLDEAVHAVLSDADLARRREEIADDTFRGHRSLDEAVRTFDTALQVLPLHRTRVPLRVLFEARLRLDRLRHR